MSLLARAADALWDPWLLGFFLLTGLLLSLGCGFFPLFRVRLWLSATLGSLFRPRDRPVRGISSLQALSTALASTIGTGSIAGVAAAIYLGGPGAVFWMWVSALLGMATSCVEKLLAVRYHCPSPDGGWQGGPMYYLRDGLHCPVLAAWFALACLPATLAGGNLIQSGSIASALHAALGWDRLAVGLGTALLAGLILTGGMGRVARVAQRLVPAMALLYLGSGLAVLLLVVALPVTLLRIVLTLLRILLVLAVLLVLVLIVLVIFIVLVVFVVLILLVLIVEQFLDVGVVELGLRIVGVQAQRVLVAFERFGVFLLPELRVAQIVEGLRTIDGRCQRIGGGLLLYLCRLVVHLLPVKGVAQVVLRFERRGVGAQRTHVASGGVLIVALFVGAVALAHLPAFGVLLRRGVDGQQRENE